MVATTQNSEDSDPASVGENNKRKKATERKRQKKAKRDEAEKTVQECSLAELGAFMRQKYPSLDQARDLLKDIETAQVRREELDAEAVKEAEEMKSAYDKDMALWRSRKATHLHERLTEQPKPQPAVKKGKITLDRMPGFTVSGMPGITALLDTGSSITIIRRRIANDMFIHPKNPARTKKWYLDKKEFVILKHHMKSLTNPVTVQAAGGGIWQLEECFEEMKVSFDGRDAYLKIYIAENDAIPQDLLLGKDGLTQLGFDFLLPNGRSVWNPEGGQQSKSGKATDDEPAPDAFEKKRKHVVNYMYPWFEDQEDVDEDSESCHYIGFNENVTFSSCERADMVFDYPPDFHPKPGRNYIFEPSLDFMTQHDLHIHPALVRGCPERKFLTVVENVSDTAHLVPAQMPIGAIIEQGEFEDLNLDETQLNHWADVAEARKQKAKDKPAEAQTFHLVIRNLAERRKQLRQQIDWSNSALTPRQRETFMTEVLDKNLDVIALHEEEIGSVDPNLAMFDVETEDEDPIQHKGRRLTPQMLEKVKAQIEKMTRMGLIRPAGGKWSSAIVVVPKPNGKIRIVADYRDLNLKTKRDGYGMQFINAILANFGEKSINYLTTMDIVAGFHQIRCTDRASEKTAFVFPGGFYEYIFMPMGTKNSPAVFQRLMDNVLRGMDARDVECYIDDVLVKSQTFEQHLILMKEVFRRFKEAGIMVGLDKCNFCRKEITFLGYTVTGDGMRAGDRKIKAIKDFPAPTNVKKVREFLGLSNFYRRFVPHYAAIALPINKLLRKEVEFKWGKEQEDGFAKIKEILCSDQVLAHPDSTKPFYLQTDASKAGIGAALSQKESDGRFRPLGWASRTLRDAETRYTATELEALAVVFGLAYFKYTIMGKDIILQITKR